MKLLIVEDNQSLSENVSTYLSKEGYVCEKAFSYQEATQKLISFDYDIVLLDIMLPDGNGMDVLRTLKQNRSEVGVLIISAKNAMHDKITGLDLGADDYLTKPFHLPELNARLKAIYRRRNFQGSKEVVFNEIRINTDTHEVFISDTALVLTGKEYELLLYFLANKNRVLTKQSIAEHLWGDYMDLQDSFDFVYQHIKNLRKKITKSGGKDYISNLYGIGYKFNSQVV
ncbi:response regulator transcription factor [Fulvivirgaceae bacterium BMA10]|uniref:Response regulator transcription factor n=1 Tax=Splendidivirga corallicola TaxID=3051826 RepID=A0ABT8KKS4_9BACT|nr:response regulator transcription factor [Fulvivirgaceae bacterium BMA10]